jgi:hypothetical protein
MKAQDQLSLPGYEQRDTTFSPYMKKHAEWSTMPSYTKRSRSNGFFSQKTSIFGEKVYRERHGHRGVILLRLADERAVNKVETIRRLLAEYAAQLADRFVVVTEIRVRFARS